MEYRFDPELLPYVELLSAGDLTDVPATRQWLDDMAHRRQRLGPA